MEEKEACVCVHKVTKSVFNVNKIYDSEPGKAIRKLYLNYF